MNRDDIIRMAQECYLIGVRPHLDGIYQESLERFANLVAAAEREACARVCDEEKLEACWHEDAHTVAAYLASVIRARGEE